MNNLTLTLVRLEGVHLEIQTTSRAWMQITEDAQ